MKKLMICVLALTCVMGITAFAQQDTMAPAATDKAAASAPLMNLKGTIKADGDKYSFVNDKDSKSWDVMNPEALKGHEGHHVQLSAHVYADKNAIHVMSVKMLKGGAKDTASATK
jgi:hypothetical protein